MISFFSRLRSLSDSILFVLDGLLQSVFVYFFVYAIFCGNIFYKAGWPLEDKLFIGAAIAGYAITVSNLTVGSNILNWTWIAWVVIILEVLSVYLYLLAYGSIQSLPELYGYWRILFGTLDFWVGLFLVVVCSLAPSTCSKVIQRTWRPRDVDVVRELQLYNLPLPGDGRTATQAEAVLTGKPTPKEQEMAKKPTSPHVSYPQGLEQGYPAADISMPRGSRSLSRRMSVYSTLSRKSETYAGFAFDKTDPQNHASPSSSADFSGSHEDDGGGVTWGSTLNTMQRAEAEIGESRAGNP